MGLDMYLMRYSKYEGQNLDDWSTHCDSYDVSKMSEDDPFRKMLEHMGTPVVRTHHLYDVATIERDFDMEPGTGHIGMVGGGEALFVGKNSGRRIEARLTSQIIDEKYTLTEEVNELAVSWEEVAYWRKANAIHNWFVENCQNGIDECQTTPVTPEQLQSLLDLCRTVLNNPDGAPDNLPTTEGFFFGGTEYDEYYREEVENTVKKLEKVLETVSPIGWYVCYHASW